MSDLIKVKQQGEARCEGTSYQDLLDQETVAVPAYLRENTNPYMGDDDIDVARWISRDFHEKEKEKLWPKVWQMACREEDIPEIGDHHIYEIVNQSVIVTRTGENEFKGYINPVCTAAVYCATAMVMPKSLSAPSMAPPGTSMANLRAFLASGTLNTSTKKICVYHR